MIVFLLELFGGVCAFSTIAFIGLASVSKLRPDLDEEGGADLEILLLTKDHLSRHWEADLDLDAVIDDAGRSAAPSRRPEKIRSVAPNEGNQLHARRRVA
jgi:hypothetical protein